MYIYCCLIRIKKINNMKRIFVLFIDIVILGYVSNAQYITISEQDANITNSNGSVKQVTPTVTDIDGNVYNTVTIDNQIWMKENLKTTRYNDGTAIPFVNSASIVHTPAYFWYNNDEAAYKAIYGALYNGGAVVSYRYKLCPVGWHVPSDEEWTKLSSYLRGDSIAGKKLKEVGTVHWAIPNDATNESGFTALPGGHRTYTGDFSDVGKKAYFWSSSGGSRAFIRELHNDASEMFRITSADWESGFCVRCLADTLASSVTDIKDSEEISIFPNPANSVVYIKNIKSLNLLVSVLDLQGKELLSKQIDSDSSIDISNLNKGIYIFKCINEKMVLTHKIIKE